jgi:Fic family protein
MRIITRKLGNKEYFYLQHSIRIGKTIVTREKYLGAEVPKNINEITSEFKKDIERDLYSKLVAIKNSFQAEWKKIPESARKKEIEEISISFTYNTNAIEGSTITLEEAREIIHDKIAPNKPLRDVKETEAHNKIFLQMLEKREKMTNELMLGWHKAIFGDSKQDIAGEYRTYFVRVGDYLAPDWQDVKKLMNGLVDFVNSNEGKMNAVELAARAHYKFEKTHPFGDGNGRIGRLLMNQILWHEGYPMLIIEYKKRKSYYKALQKDEEHFVAYFIRRYLAVHKNRIKKIIMANAIASKSKLTKKDVKKLNKRVKREMPK